MFMRRDWEGIVYFAERIAIEMSLLFGFKTPRILKNSIDHCQALD